MRTSSYARSAVWLARIPIFFQTFVSLNPAVPFGTAKAEIPAKPVPGSSEANTTVRSAIPPQVMKRLLPFSTYSSPSRTAVVFIAPASEPESGSVNASAPSRISPSVGVHMGRNRAACSGVAMWLIAVAASAFAIIPVPIPPHPQESSSAMISAVIPSSPPCPPNGPPASPRAAPFFVTSHANSSRSSNSAATGRISFTAKSCARLRTMRSASLDWKSVMASIRSVLLPIRRCLYDDAYTKMSITR